MTRRYAHLGPNKLRAVVSLLGASDTGENGVQVLLCNLLWNKKFRGVAQW